MDAIGLLNVGLAGRYGIEREIGGGGMATVFLARDLRHDRRVALKVLKPELAAMVGAERFLSEIRVTARLQHPNLLPLFDSGACDGLLYYVMPYVDGESLRHRLDREKQLPVDEAARVAIAICGALDSAHRHGVIHRDLKPENVLLHDGQPLIADFGIALAISNAAGARLTQTGISVGTPQYMSPEQATADRTIDARTDVYSVGALMYEMLTGEAPHTGPTAQAIIAKLLSEDPRPVSSLRRSVPAHLAAAVHRALQKLPADRFATAHEFGDALSGKTGVVLPSLTPPARSLRTWKLATSAFAAIAVAAVAWAARPRDAAPPTQQLRFSLGLPDSVAMDISMFYRSFDLSPDGKELVYFTANGLFIRPLNELTPRRLTTEAGRDPRFSPDGAWVGYVSYDTLRKVPVDGGPPRTIIDSVGRFGWSPSGTIVFTRSGNAVAELWRVSERGGRAQRFVQRRRPNDAAYGTPTFLPDSDTFLVPVASSGSGSAEIAAYRFSDDSMRYLGVRGDHPLYIGDGVLLYVDTDEAVYAQSLNLRTLRISGAATRVFDGVMRKLSSAELAVSATGVMGYLPRAVPLHLVEYDRTGRERELRLPAGLYANPRYSPDGRRFTVGVGHGPSMDIVVYDVATLTPRQLTTNGRAHTPEWTRDGRRIGWTQIEGAIGGRAAELSASSIVWRAADGSDSATVLLREGLGMAFSPAQDAGLVIVRRDGRLELNMVQVTSPSAMTPIMEIVGPSLARISPDGRWVAYQSTVTGRSEVYVRRVPTGRPIPISVGGGTEPMWNPRGGELFYRTGARLVGATLSLDSDQPIMRRDTLPFRIATSAVGPWSSYDVAPNGQRFLMGKGATASNQPIVITGWLDEVRGKLKARR